MVRVQHFDITQVQRSNPVRPFHTLGVTPFVSRVMLGGTLILGIGCSSVILPTPRTAMAQGETQEIGGRKFQVRESLPKFNTNTPKSA